MTATKLSKAQIDAVWEFLQTDVSGVMEKDFICISVNNALPMWGYRKIHKSSLIAALGEKKKRRKK